MLGRALSLATVTLLIGCFATAPARAQAQNLEAGKSPSQIFAGTCNACHKSPRGLLKTVPAGSLPSFLRQHYTTSGDMASLLASFLISNGATDTRYVGSQTKPGAKPEAGATGTPDHIDRFGRRTRPATPPTQEAAKPDAEPQQAAKPDSDGLSPQADPARQGRNAKRLARPGEAPTDAAKPAADGQTPVQAASDRGPDGRKLSAKQKLSKRGKPGEELPKTDTAKTDAAKDEPAKGEASKDDKPKSEAAKDEGKPAGAPSAEPKSDTAKSDTAKADAPNKVDAPKETSSGEPPVLRADPVPPVTPAPPASLAKSAAASSAPPEPAAAPSALSAPPAPPAAAVTASAPPVPVTPAGPPTPPISQ